MSKDNVCPECKGEKEIVRMLKEPFFTTPFNIYKDRERIICPTCNGTGRDKQEEKQETKKCLSCINVITHGDYCSECSDTHDGRSESNSDESYWKRRYVKEYQSKCDLEIKLGKQQSLIDEAVELLNRIIRKADLEAYEEARDFLTKIEKDG